jgi:FlaA1/EpsC-like NDP-sugar epimerase
VSSLPSAHWNWRDGGPLRRLTRAQRQALLLLLDAALIALSFYLAFALRFDGAIPPERVSQFLRHLPVLLALRIALHVFFGIHRWSFRLSGFHEAVRVVETSLCGSAAFVAVFYFLQRAEEDLSVGPPRSVVVMEFLLTTTFIGALRFSRRLAHMWFSEAQRGAPNTRVRTLIVGAGNAGELLLRDLQRSNEHPYRVLGFVDDQQMKWGTTIGGRPVLGGLEDLPELVRRWHVRQLLFAIPRLHAPRLRQLLSACAGAKLNYKILPVSFEYLNDRVSTSMLQDLAPEDLLPRHQVAFDAADVRTRVLGRRMLVTGAGGSIGREICRQLAAGAPEQLVLVDTNENSLYLLYRELERRFPRVSLVAEVADVRDSVRMRTLGRRCRPQDVLHAAAHKHVPLMEAAPEEAVKTNVGGCRSVAMMAHESGAERFVLISTDKAVNPAGAMGATKSLAELIVRDQAVRSQTRCTIVRFGNVLGSAGSVVPLFKEQIAAGGPVTVTHPDCRRFLMTIGEAVGLVLRAGLGGHGDLCILEMGEPMKILDLARLMITMSGLVPDEEIPIVFTGLRPGDKLEEELMTAEEEAGSRAVDESIRAIAMDPPSPATMQRIAELEALAWQGDRAGVTRLLSALVPTYGRALAEWDAALPAATVVPMPGVRAAAPEDEVQARRTSAAMRSTSSSGSSG